MAVISRRHAAHRHVKETETQNTAVPGSTRTCTCPRLTAFLRQDRHAAAGSADTASTYTASQDVGHLLTGFST